MFYIPHSCFHTHFPLGSRLGGSWTTRDKRPAPTKKVKYFLHTPQKLHLFDGTPGQEGHVGFVFCFKKIVFIGQNKNQYEGLIVGVYYLAKVYFHLLSAGPVGHDDLCHIVAPFFVFMFYR